MGKFMTICKKCLKELSTRQQIMTCSRLLKTGYNNVVLPILFFVVNNIVQHC